MKISLIFIGTTGAGPVYSYEMAKALAADQRCQLQVIISANVSNLDVWKATFADSPVDFHVVKTYNRNKVSVFLNSFNLLRKYHIYKLIKTFRPDVVYSPFVLLWERFLFGMMHGKAHVIKTIHDLKLHDSYHNLGDFMTKMLNWGSMRYVDSIVLLNRKDQPLAEQRYHRPTVVIPHASFSYYSNKPAQGEFHVKKTIAFIGRIEPYKGLDLLLEAFKALKTPDVKLIIAGNGKIEDKLLKSINEEKNIELINRYIEDDEFQQLFCRTDFIILPYKRASQSGVIPLCFANGLTVVATNVGAIAEQVPEGTGIIVNPTADDISQAIDSLYDHQELIAKYGNAAYEYSQTHLTWENSASILIQHITSVTKCPVSSANQSSQ